jgi:hypothetical protein
MKKTICIIFCMLLISVTTCVSGTFNIFSNYDVKNILIHETESYDPLDEGWIEERDGVTILHTSGSSYDMGYQQGSLLMERILECSQAVFNYLEQHGISYNDLLDTWDVMKEYVPPEIIEEMHGLADGSGISFDKIAAVNMFSSIYHDITCCGSAAWGPATIDNKLYHMRSYDSTPNIRDPVNGTYLQENQILIVREPNNGQASLYPAFACDVGSTGGINENGIGIGYKLSWSYDDETIHGISKEFRVKMALDIALTEKEAIDIINANRTKGTNFIISDGKIPICYVVEQTANLTYNGTWDDPVESIDPFWEIDHVVRRTNVFLDPTLAAVQRNRYNPQSFLLWLLFKFGLLNKSNFYPHWSHYKTLSKEIEKHWGTMDLNATMSMLRTVYSGRTDFSFFIIRKIIRLFTSLHQWVSCPETGDMVVSFADADKSAYENPVHYFNLFELLESEPP